MARYRRRTGNEFETNVGELGESVLSLKLDSVGKNKFEEGWGKGYDKA